MEVDRRRDELTYPNPNSNRLSHSTAAKIIVSPILLHVDMSLPELDKV
jgi:hypothetical protein